MTLTDLGFDSWFQEKFAMMDRADFNVARVTRVDRERFLVRNETGEAPAEPTGRLLYSAGTSEEIPCVGDWVLVQYYNDGALAIIHDLLPRRTILRRKSAGRKIDYQPIAANIDIALIVQSCDSDFNIRRLERYLVMVHEGGIAPLVLLNKCDLVSREELDHLVSRIRQAGIDEKIITSSNLSPTGLDDLKKLLRQGKTYSLLGSSGVGKTTLLNRLLGSELYETNPVREKDGRGRHTTAHRHLNLLPGGALLIDTPGMRELGMIGVEVGIAESFPEIRALSEDCRFNDCTHTSEAGCAILAALGSGALDEDRYRGYIKLIKEAAYHDRSYVEKRKKDREFGRMVKSVMKQKKKGRD